MVSEWLFTEGVVFFCALVLFIRCMEFTFSHLPAFLSTLRREINKLERISTFFSVQDFYCFFPVSRFYRKA